MTGAHATGERGRAADFSEIAPWSLLAGAWALVVLVAARWLPSLSALVPGCPFYALTGLPCPTCGGTRALLALARGDLAGAFVLQPLVVLLALAALGAGVAAAVWAVVGRPALRRPVPATASVARGVLIALLLNWVYLLVAMDPSS